MRYKNEVLTRVESLQTTIDYLVKTMHTGQLTPEEAKQQLIAMQKKIEAMKNFVELEPSY